MLNILFIAFIVLIVNIPFGMWRGSERKLSLNWFLAIHIPVLISIGLRYIAGIDFEWYLLFLFVAVFFTGQYIGQRLYFIRKKKVEVICTKS